MRLIDADALDWEYIEHEHCTTIDTVRACKCLVLNAPTIDPASLIEKPVYLDAEKVAKIVMERLENNGTIYIDGPMVECVPVQHGRWDGVVNDNGEDEVVCSVCGYVDTDTAKETPHNYCPNCGARMDGGTENA